LCEHYATCRGYVTALYLAPIFVTRGIARKKGPLLARPHKVVKEVPRV
jgi:hypothetical protein